VKRPGEQIVRTTVGSILEGLSESKRQTIIYGEAWLPSLTDEVLVYGNDRIKSQLTQWEREASFRDKYIYDYALLLEDDVIAVREWYGKTLKVLEQLDDQAHGSGD
jgi:hypothetical protein